MRLGGGKTGSDGRSPSRVVDPGDDGESRQLNPNLAARAHSRIVSWAPRLQSVLYSTVTFCVYKAADEARRPAPRRSQRRRSPSSLPLGGARRRTSCSLPPPPASEFPSRAVLLLVSRPPPATPTL